MELQFLGNDSYGGWMTNVAGLTQDSIVYSFGVGFDISWDREMIRLLGCQVFAFDPTDSSKKWLEGQELPDRFSFSQVGLSTFDGMQTFYLPLREGKADYSTVKKGNASMKFPVKMLETIMKENGHTRIDVLKMDIEGSEFAVLPQIAHLPIGQILVELHPNMYASGWKGIRRLLGRYRLDRVMRALKRNGFTCVHKNRDDYTFINARSR